MSEADAVLLPARINIPLRVTSFLWLFSSALRDRSVSARLTGMGETPGKVPSWHLFRVGSLGRVGSLSKLASYTIWDREGSTLFSERRHSTEKTNWWELPVRFEQIYSSFPDLREELWLAAFGTSLWLMVLCRISLSPGLWVYTQG